jgi:hypothetical protein
MIAWETFGDSAPFDLVLVTSHLFQFRKDLYE